MLQITDFFDAISGPEQPKPRKLDFRAKMPELTDESFEDLNAPKMRMSIPDEAKVDYIKEKQIQKKQETKDPNRRVRRGEETTLF